MNDNIFIHRMGKQALYDSVYDVVNAANDTNTLSFNKDDNDSPSF
jgi:hypothetical protein